MFNLTLCWLSKPLILVAVVARMDDARARSDKTRPDTRTENQSSAEKWAATTRSRLLSVRCCFYQAQARRCAVDRPPDVSSSYLLAVHRRSSALFSFLEPETCQDRKELRSFHPYKVREREEETEGAPLP